MKNIYILAQQLKSGGCEKAVIQQANMFEEYGNNVTIFSFFTTEPIIPINNNVKVVFLTQKQLKYENKFFRVKRKISELISIKQCIKRIKDGIIISSRNEYSVLLSRYGDKNVKKIGQLHNEYTKKYVRDFQNNYKNIDYLCVLNDIVKKEIENLIFDYNKKTHVVTIPNFIEKVEFPLVSRTNTVISVAYMLPVKGFDRLIKIWAMVKHKDWKLCLIGDGPEYENIKQLIRDYNLQERITMLGKLENIKVLEMMNQAKLYALPSYKEAFGFVIIEAMMCGLPVVSFDVRTGPQTLITNGYNGYLISDNDLEAFARKLDELMEDTELVDNLSKKSCEFSDRYTKKNVFKLWEQIL